MSSLYTTHSYGWSFKNENVFVFFGNKNFEASHFKNLFPDFKFHRIKQTHSDLLIEASSECLVPTQEGDAHWSGINNLALVVSTADCVPALVFCEKTRRIASIHAGWKGVANQITKKTLKFLLETGSNKDSFHFWIGPHIQQTSFVVQKDVFELLLLSTDFKDKSDFYKEDSAGYWVSLIKILRSQLMNDLQINLKNWHSLALDTFTESSVWSHRRDKEKAGRNLSFISLLSP